jgi:serine carboxypeptidase-like clade 1
VQAPILVWYTGGPGGSSLFGLLVEIGPFTLTASSLEPAGSVPELFYNNYTWGKQFNLLFPEFPPPVGFSYCTEPGGCPVWNDTSAAQENYHFLVNFFRAYPELAANEVYLTGESYAGVYVPELVKFILAGNSRGSNDSGAMAGSINLKGMALGDVCLGTQSFGGCASVDETFWHIEFMHGHQQMSLGLYQDLLSTCGVVNLRFGNYTDVPGCQPLLDSLQYQLGGYNVLSLYDQCYLYQPPQLRLASGRWLSDYPCGGEYAMAVWVNNTEVGKEKLQTKKNERRKKGC